MSLCLPLTMQNLAFFESVEIVHEGQMQPLAWGTQLVNGHICFLFAAVLDLVVVLLFKARGANKPLSSKGEIDVPLCVCVFHIQTHTHKRGRH